MPSNLHVNVHTLQQAHGRSNCFQWINILRGSLSSNMRKCAPPPWVCGMSGDDKNMNNDTMQPKKYSIETLVLLSIFLGVTQS